MFIYTLKELSFFFNHILLIYCLLYYLYYLLPDGEKCNHSIIFILLFFFFVNELISYTEAIVCMQIIANTGLICIMHIHHWRWSNLIHSLIIQVALDQMFSVK